jgi:hypothetical protein
VLTSPTSRWVAGTAGVCAALLALTWFALVGPKRAEAAELVERTEATQQQNDALRIRTAQLKAQFATLPQRQAELSQLVGQMPVTADVPRFVRSLDAMATAAGVRLEGITPGAGTPLAAAGAPGAAGAAPKPQPAEATAPAAAAAPGAAGTAGSSAGGAPATAMNVVAVPVTVTVRGPYFKAVTFLKSLQTAQRAFLVNGLQVTVADDEVALTIRGRIFALPGAAAALTGVPGSPAAPAAKP